jgi:hypothetical protein
MTHRAAQNLRLLSLAQSLRNALNWRSGEGVPVVIENRYQAAKARLKLARLKDSEPLSMVLALLVIGVMIGLYVYGR